MLSKIKQVICIFMLIIAGCEKDGFNTGIMGLVEYGPADCMPGPGRPIIGYEKYNGIVYFVNKRAYENLGNGNFEELKEAGIKTKIRNGELSITLPVDTFFVMLEGMHQNTFDHIVIIEQGVILNRDFRIWRCTSY